MNNCYQNWKDIIRIEFFNPASLTFKIPEQIYSPTIKVGSPASTGVELIIPESVIPTHTVSTPNGWDKLTTSKQEELESQVKGSFVPRIDDMSASLSVDSNISVSGTKYKVSLDYKMYSSMYISAEFASHLRALQNNRYIIRLTYITGNQSILRTTAGSWTATTKQSDGVVKVSISFENWSGEQRVT